MTFVPSNIFKGMFPSNVGNTVSIFNFDVKSLILPFYFNMKFEETFDKLDIREGWVIAVGLGSKTRTPTYTMIIDFGKFRKRASHGRFTMHSFKKRTTGL